MHRFSYHRAKTLDEAAKAFRTAADGTFIAGGMTVIPAMKQRLAAPTDVIDISKIEGLAGIEEREGCLLVGAMALHAEVAASEAVKKAIPALASLAGTIGDPQVRNRGTLGGSLANNDPAADYPAAVLGLGATIITNQKEIAADAFFTGFFETALSPGEIITGVSFPRARRAAYAKFPNPVSRYALVGVFVADFGDRVRVAVTGAGPCVFRLGEMEAALEKDFSAAAISDIDIEAGDLNEDIHASAWYRAHLIKVMAKRAVEEMAK